MSQPLTIVMYHYVRDLARTRYPRIKALDVAGFRRQLDYLETKFAIVGMEAVIAAIRGEDGLAPNAALLTFDDGYAEHHGVVFPILHERGLSGSFFPPVLPVRDRILLDVNRLHFVLASAPSPAMLVQLIDSEVADADPADGLKTVDEYRAEWAHPNRFDDADTIYVKRMLQTALPDAVRAAVARRLFARFVTSDEQDFASELYLSCDEAKVMVANGMYFGSHGLSHRWLNRVDQTTQAAEIDGSLQFLGELGMPVGEQWVMCYPFGGWNEALLEVLRERSCSVGLTTDVATATIGADDPLTLPRYDTNDFPQ